MAESLSRKFGIDEDLAKDIIHVLNLVSASSMEDRQAILHQSWDMDLKRAFDFLTAKEKIRPRTTDLYHFHLWRADWSDDAEYLVFLLRWALSTGETRRRLFWTSDVGWKKRFLFALYVEGSKPGTCQHHTGLLLDFIESLQDGKRAALRLLTKSACAEIIGDLHTREKKSSFIRDSLQQCRPSVVHHVLTSPHLRRRISESGQTRKRSAHIDDNM